MKKLKEILMEARSSGDLLKIARNQDYGRLESTLESHYNNFSPGETQNIGRYSTGEGYWINRLLWDKHHKRKSGVINQKEYLDFSDNLNKTLQAHKTPESFSVFSGIKSHYEPEKNKIYHHPAFLSTSLDLGMAKSSAKFQSKDYTEHQHILHIQVPKDHPGAYIGHVSRIPSEKEFLLPKGLNLRHKYTHSFGGHGGMLHHVHHMEIV